MEKTETILFYDKCRLCLENLGVKNIFETQDLQHDIFVCTGVKVSPSDNLPQKICSYCSDVVTKAKKLRSLADKNDKHLKSLFVNEHDDDSVDTLCIIEYSDDDENSPQSHVPDVLLTSQGKRKIGTEEDSDTEKGDLLHKNKVKVRKDLFNTTPGDDVVLVRSKEDYNKYKKQIKLEVGVTVVYECEICEKRFDNYKKLYLHTRHHNKAINCPLDACGKKFASKGDLERHLRTHTGVRPYTCEICDRSFTQQGTLKTHKETVHYCFVVP